MEKVGEDEEKSTEEASNSVTETRTDKEEERIRGTIAELVDSTEEGSTDPSYSHTVTIEDDDDNEYEMEDGEVLELFRRKNSARSEVTERDKVNLNSPGILEGTKSSSASDEDTEDDDDSSSNSDLDSSLSRYYFDGSLPVSAHVQESETHQDEGPPEPKDENLKISLLCPKQHVQQPTSWRNCCGLLQLLRAANP